MENLTIKTYMVNKYNELASTHDYVLGLKIKGMWYACFVKGATDLLLTITTHTNASTSHGGGNILRFLPNKATREIILARSEKVEPLCSVKYMDEIYANYNGNRGNIFEELLAKKYNGKLANKKNACFTDCGDIEINGNQYQCKIEKATWTTESTLQNLAA